MLGVLLLGVYHGANATKPGQAAKSGAQNSTVT